MTTMPTTRERERSADCARVTAVKQTNITAERQPPPVAVDAAPLTLNLTTATSGIGIGMRLSLNLLRNDWSPLKGEFPVKFQGFGAEGVYYPALSAKDEGVSRGTSSPGSSGYSMRLSATALAWFDFIPLVKRWFIQGSYGFRAYSLKFSGPTTPEAVPSPVVIPEGGSATERESDFRIFFGIRLDDPVKYFIKDKGKK